MISGFSFRVPSTSQVSFGCQFSSRRECVFTGGVWSNDNRDLKQPLQNPNLTALVDDFEGSREEYARRRLSRGSMDIAIDRLKMASFLQYTLPGSPSLYYGDEACMEGYRDPFNRPPLPLAS